MISYSIRTFIENPGQKGVSETMRHWIALSLTGLLEGSLGHLKPLAWNSGSIAHSCTFLTIA